MVIYKHEYFLSACVYLLKFTSILTIEFFLFIDEYMCKCEFFWVDTFVFKNAS